MRSVVRRLLWLGPTLLLITAVTFGVLSVALPPAPGNANVPLFFNPEPGAAPRLALAAMRAVASGGARSVAAARELEELGGAALPFVLPALDSLSPEERARVVRALAPVGARMGLDVNPSWDASRQVRFWTRYWDEHSIDYRPTVARRAVLRFVQRSTELRDAEVRQLDTYALDELMTQLAETDLRADADRARRIASLAADITGKPDLALRDAAALGRAEQVTAAWLDWWSAERSRFETYSGTERVTAMLRDTRYGSWVARAVRGRLGSLENGRAAADVLVEGARVTLPLLLAGIIGAWALSVGGGAALTLPGPGGRRLMRVLGVLRAAIPAVLLAVMLGAWVGAPARHTAVGALVMLVAGAPLLASRGGGNEAAASDFARTLASVGISGWRAVPSMARLSSAAILAQLGAHMSNLLTRTFAVEYALGLPGLGTTTIAALHAADLNWLMAITITTALFIGVLQAASELLLGVLDPRWEEARVGIGGDA